MANIQILQNLPQILSLLLAPDNAKISQGEELIRQISKDSTSVPAFFQIMIKNTFDSGIRQLSGVILKQIIKNLWRNVDDKMKESIKTNILSFLYSEPDGKIRSAAISTLCAIAKQEIQKNSWPKLFPFISEMVKTGNPVQRTISFSIFHRLTETIPSKMRPNVNVLVTIFKVGLNEEIPEIQLSSLKATQALFEEVVKSEKEILAVRPLLEDVVKLVQKCLSKKQESIAIEAFGVFDKIAEFETEAFNSAIPSLIQLMVSIVDTKNFEPKTRFKAMDFVAWVIYHKPNIIIKQNLYNGIINIIFKILCEPSAEEKEEFFNSQKKSDAEDEDEDEDLDEDEDEDTPFVCGQRALAELSCAVPSKFVFKPIIEKVPILIESQDVFMRRAGYTSLGIIAQGCIEQMRQNCAQVVKIMLQGVSEKEVLVREAALVGFGYMIENLQPEIIQFVDQIIPCLGVGLNEKNFHIVEGTAAALNNLLERIGTRIVPHLPTLFNTSLGLLTNTKSSRCQEIALPLIANMAQAAGKNFSPYFEMLMPYVMKLISLDDDKITLESVYVLKGRAIECVGIVARALGAEIFTAKYFEATSPAIFKTMKDSVDPFVREMCYVYISNLSEVMKSDFAPFLPMCLEEIFESVELEDTVLENKTSNQASFLTKAQIEEQPETATQAQNEDSDLDKSGKQDSQNEGEDEDDEDPEDDMVAKVRTSLVDEKAAAFEAMGYLAKNTQQAFLPFLQKALEILGMNYNYWYDPIRRSVIRGLTDVGFVLKSSSNTSDPNIQASQAKLLENIGNILTEILEGDEDKECVALACDGLFSLIREFGLQAFEEHAQRILDAVHKLLLKKANCNKSKLDEEDDIDHDHVLIDAVADLIDVFAHALGSNFEPHFKKVAPSLFNYLGEKKSMDDKLMALGTFAEVAKSMGTGFRSFVPQLLPIAIRTNQINHPRLKQNVLFLMGVLALSFPDLMQPHLQLTLSELSNTLQHKKEMSNLAEYDGILDNCCATICRLVMSQLQNVPTTLLMQALLTNLPVREDFDENFTIFKCLMLQLQQTNAQNQFFAPIAKLVVQGLSSGEKEVPPPLKKQIVNFFISLKSNPQQLQQIISALDDKDKAILQKALN